MYFKQSKLDKTTQVVDFCYSKKTFIYQGIEFQIYPDTKNTRTPDIALKRNDTKPHKRLSGLFKDGSILQGDIRTDKEKRYFTLEISEDKRYITLVGFQQAISLVGINTPLEQNELFKEPLRALEMGIKERYKSYSERGVYVIGI